MPRRTSGKGNVNQMPTDVNDYSEFPSLSGAPQPQHQNPAQAVWANANQRAAQHTPVQRPQQSSGNQQHPPLQPPSQPQQPQQQPQQQHDDLFAGFPPVANGLDEFRLGGQSGVGQISSMSQPQTTNIDEFPPLGRNANGEIGQDRRGGLLHNAAFGGYSNGSGFGANIGQHSLQNRGGLFNIMNGQQDSRSSAVVDRIVSPSNQSSGGEDQGDLA